ncbi:MAG: ferritin-like domain-containing protein [Elusimicrobiota bacterium]|nr:ferritin-like domain-containing protein [Elusimicrobiota bacterium]
MEAPMFDAPSAGLRIGSAQHRDALCRFFTDSFVKLDAEGTAWPELPPEALDRLRALPIWEEAVKTEATTAHLVQSFGRRLKDPGLREAVAMNGFEEGRHAAMLAGLTRRYGIAVPSFAPEETDDPEWGFLKVGYGECFDSFFGFGLFALARDSGFFPSELVTLFEPIMQEEARHIIFHANWVAYSRAEKPAAERLAFAFKEGMALFVQTKSRAKTALRVKNDEAQDNFTMAAHASFGDVTPRRFLETCLAENARRLAPYDPRLLRPTFMPALARAALAVMPG